jgi:hypothetical protein
MLPTQHHVNILIALVLLSHVKGPLHIFHNEVSDVGEILRGLAGLSKHLRGHRRFLDCFLTGNLRVLDRTV